MRLFNPRAGRPDHPHPPSFSEGLARASAPLPEGIEIAFKPYRSKGVRNPQPYRVIRHGVDVGGSASREGALFAALRAAPILGVERLHG